MKLKIAALVILLVPFLVFAQDTNAKKKAYFFYLDTCPHCHNVNDYFNANGVYDKYDIEKLDASIPQNGQFLMKLYAANNYPENQRGGVPVVAFGDKFFVGDQPIIDNFVKDIEASDSAYQLPNPDQSGGELNIVVHNGPIASGASENKSASQENSANNVDAGNKNNYVPVIIAGLVIVGAGALIFANRKS